MATKILIPQTWDGRQLTEVFTVAGEKFKTTCSLRNGTTYHSVSILGTDGWSLFLSSNEIGFEFNASRGWSDPCYVSDEDERKDWCTQCADALKKAVEKVYA